MAYETRCFYGVWVLDFFSEAKAVVADANPSSNTNDRSRPYRRKEEWTSCLYHTSTPTEHMAALFELLREYNNVFAWTYAKMPGLDPYLVTHQLTSKKKLCQSSMMQEL